MKKALVAGAASAVLAAMPVLGVFAEGVTSGAGSYTDNFSVTITPICTFSRLNTAHVDGNATAIQSDDAAVAKPWSNGTDPFAGADPTGTTGDAGRADTLTMGALVAGNTYSMGGSSFNVVCNTTGGYDINLSATSLHDSETYGNATGDDITYSGAAVSNSGSTWTVSDTELSDSMAGTPTYYANNGKVKTSATATTTAGDNFSVYYHLGLKSSQAKGIFTGSATYTLVQPAQN